MRSADRSILIALAIVGLIACFWFLVLSPKRERAAELETQVETLQGEVAQQEQLAADAELAQASYEQNYERLVVLGKAAPEDGDMPSLLTQLSSLSKRSGVDFGALTVSEAPEVPAPATSESTTDQNQPEEGAAAPASATATPAATAPAPPTEANAALLPLGATVGPAGLGVLPYSLQFQGDFFKVADLLKGLDGLVATGKRTKVAGRLLTVNGFSMAPGEGDQLAVDLEVMSYVLPASQGLTAGATPAAPPASVPPTTPTPTPTATTP